eukprot:jgi/Psemu1/287101/fgenesh1_pg.175_\
MSVQTSQRIVESQQQLWMQTAMLSQQQHQERLRAATYDPNWREKFRVLRDESYYWNLTDGGAGRLLWEVLLIQPLARGIVPVLWQYYYSYSNGTQWNTAVLVGTDTDTDRWIVSFLRDSVISILTQVCDCRPQTSHGPSVAATATATSLAQSTLLSWMIPTTASTAFSISTGILPGLMENWSCYAYCLVSASTLLISTIILHHGLRMLSMPSSLHHVVNLASVAMLYGPHRTLTLLDSNGRSMSDRGIAREPSGSGRVRKHPRGGTKPPETLAMATDESSISSAVGLFRAGSVGEQSDNNGDYKLGIFLC